MAEAGETTTLLPTTQDGATIKLSIHIEMLRFVGLAAGGVLLITGWFITTYFVVYPEKENPSTFFQKLFGGAPSDFDETQTFIYEMFHFSHTCTFLDFNPSKTCAALIIMLHTLPINAFVILHYYRVMSQIGDKWKSLKSICPTFTIIQFITFTYFYMVFVNSPYGHYGDPQAKVSFTLHYIPYMLWQMGILLMGIQQCWFVALKDVIPFGFVNRMMIWRYVQLLMVFFVVYTTFVWSFICGSPIWPTDDDHPAGKAAAKFIMFGWDFFAVLVPMVLAWFEAKDGNISIITFHEVAR